MNDKEESRQEMKKIDVSTFLLFRFPAKENKKESIMNNRTLQSRLFSVAFFLLLVLFVGQIQARENRPIPTDTPKTFQRHEALRPESGISKDMVKIQIINAMITEVRIGTRDDGSWFWKVKVRNNGSAVINPGKLSVQTMQRTNNPNASTLATGGTKIMQSIQPGQTQEVMGNWIRCSTIYEFKATLRNLVRNKNIHSKTINPVPRISLIEVKPQNIRWFDQEKKWNADIKNTSPYTLKVITQGVLQKGFNKQAVGGQVRIIPPNSTKTTMKLNAPQAENGDVLFVNLSQNVNKGYCKENGGIGGWGMNIPNSKLNIP